jgi:hypothetical protein
MARRVGKLVGRHARPTSHPPKPRGIYVKASIWEEMRAAHKLEEYRDCTIAVTRWVEDFDAGRLTHLCIRRGQGGVHSLLFKIDSIELVSAPSDLYQEVEFKTPLSWCFLLDLCEGTFDEAG